MPRPCSEQPISCMVRANLVKLSTNHVVITGACTQTTQFKLDLYKLTLQSISLYIRFMSYYIEHHWSCCYHGRWKNPCGKKANSLVRSMFFGFVSNFTAVYLYKFNTQLSRERTGLILPPWFQTGLWTPWAFHQHRRDPPRWTSISRPPNYWFTSKYYGRHSTPPVCYFNNCICILCCGGISPVQLFLEDCWTHFTSFQIVPFF